MGLVQACDATLESVHNYGSKRARLDPDIFGQKGPFGHTQDFMASGHLSERNQRLVEMTVALNESYMQFMQSFRKTNFDDEEEDRTLKLRAYFHILLDLKRAHDALKETVEAEIQRCTLKDQ